MNNDDLGNFEDDDDDLSSLMKIEEKEREKEIKPIDFDAPPQENKPPPEVSPSQEQTAPSPDGPIDTTSPAPEAPASEPESSEEEGEGVDPLLAHLDEKKGKKDLTLEDIDGRIIAKKGDFIDLTEGRPYLNVINLGAGWDQRAMEEKPLDIDFSVFLLDKNEKTKVDEDFVFYNQPSAHDGAVRFMGDSRTGAGEGDDENVVIDLRALSLDVLKVMLVFSIYDQDMLGHTFSMAKNLYIRIVEEDSGQEILRYEIDDEAMDYSTGMYAAALVREGPKWYFEPLGNTIKGGLSKIATEYDIIVQGMESSGEAEI